MFRLLHQLMNESHVWTIAGHTFLTEQHAADANRKNSIHVGVAERYGLVTKAGGSRVCRATTSTSTGELRILPKGDGVMVPVLDKETADLKPLPKGTNPLGIPVTSSSVCPSDTPVENFNVVSLDRPIKLHPKAPDVIEVDFDRKIEMTMPEGKIFALEEEATTVAAGWIALQRCELPCGMGLIPIRSSTGWDSGAHGM